MKWCKEVSKPLSNVIDMVTAEAKYNHECFIRSFTKQIKISKKKGKPKEMEGIDTFIEKGMNISYLLTNF